MQFITPEKVIFGKGEAKKIEEMKDALIITGEHVWQEINKWLSPEIPTILVRRKSTTGEPEEEDVERLSEEMREYRVNWIIAIGGGSVIDAAKIARIFYEYPDIKWSELYSSKIPKLRTKFMALETTSGTGTGVSAAAVVKSEDIKKGVVNESFVPNIAIYDPNLVMGMPKKVAIYSGMDALTHAIEAYTSNVDNLISDTLALKAIELIYHNIEDSIKGDESAREKVHYGNMLAGMGFTNSRLGLCHAAAHKIGAMYEIEHGKINAILLPYVVKVNEKYTRKFADVAKVMHVDDVAKAIMALNLKFGIPTKIDISDGLEQLGRKIAQDRLMKFNPRTMNEKEVRDFLQAVTEGNLNEV